MPIYFAACKRGDLVEAIKIGSAVDPLKKVEEMQGGCPYPIKLIGTMDGGAKEEKDLHRFYEDSRIQGKWYRPDDGMIRHILEACPNARAFGRIRVAKTEPTSDFEKRIVGWVAPGGVVNKKHPLYPLYQQMGFDLMIADF